jgi:hypothetical protein
MHYHSRLCLLLALSFAGIPLPLRALTLDELQTRLAAQAVVRCEFEQERKISGLSKPLNSRGEMLAARDNGLWWHQQKPFEMTLVLDAKRMVQTIAGQAPQIVTAEKNPQLFQFNHLLVALFRADRAVLEKSFTTTFSTPPTAAATTVPAAPAPGWTLVLVPKEAPLNKVFRRITLTGDNGGSGADASHIGQIVLEDMQNDRTTLRFLKHRTTPAELSETEKARFR